MAGTGEIGVLDPECFRAFFDNSQEMMLVCDAEGFVVEANRTLTDGLGFTRDNLIGAASLEVMHPRADIKASKKAWRSLKRKGRVDGFRTIWQRRGGGAVSVCISASACYDGDRQFSGAYVIACDETEHRRLESDLRESYGRYRRIVETTNEGIWMIDAENTTTFVNARMAEMMGYSVDEMIGRPLFSFMDTESRATVEKRLERRRRGVREQYELKFIRKDGFCLWALLEASPLPDENGQYVGALAMMTDITARKQAENDLRESEQLFRQVAENVNDIIWMMTPDQKEMLYVSPAYEEIWGQTCQSLYENPMGWLDVVHDEDKERIWKAGQDLASFDEEYRIVRPDGETRWIRDRGFPVRDESGKVYRVAGISTDVTESKHIKDELQKARDGLEVRVEERTRELTKAVTRLKQEVYERRRAEREVKEQEQTLQAIFEESFDGIVVADAETRDIKYVNPASCRMFGYSKDEMLSKGIADIHPKEDLPHVFAEFEAQVKCEKTLSQSLPCRRKDGTVFLADVSSTLALIRGRRCLVGFFKDETEVRLME